MSGFTIQQVLGANAVSTATGVTIQFADLTANAGLLAANVTDGEAVFISIILQAQNLGLDSDHRDGTTTIAASPTQQIAVNDAYATSYPNRNDANGNSISYQRDTISIDCDRLPSLNPNLY